MTEHLPYWWQLELACLQCKRVFPSSRERCEHQKVEHGEEGMIQTKAYFQWMDSAEFLLVWICNTVKCETFRELPGLFKAKGWVPVSGEQWGAGNEAMLRDLSWYLSSYKALPVHQKLDPCNPKHPVEILYWQTMMRALAHLDLEVGKEIKESPFMEDPRMPDEPSVPVEIRFPRAVDSHCHLSSSVGKSGDLRNYLENCFQDTWDRLGYETPMVVGVVNNRVFPQEWKRGFGGNHQITLEDEFGQPAVEVRVKEAIGIHPSVAMEDLRWSTVIDQMEDSDAVGECGLDFVKGSEQQRRVFRRQVRVAVRQNLPLVLHLRPGRGGLTEVIEQYAQVLRH
jgi:hypothetical protein